MSIQQLRYVVSAIRHKSNARAAAELLVSPQAISKAITVTERQFGKKLFHRTDGSRIPTEFAIRFADKAASIVADYDDLELMGQCLSHTHETIGAISVALETTSCRGGIFDESTLQLLSEYHPEITFSLVRNTAESCLQSVVFGLVDAAIVLGRTRDESLECVCIGRFSIAAIVNANHPLSLKRRITLGDLACRPVAYPTNLKITYPVITSEFSKKNLPLPVFQHLEPTASETLSFLERGGVILSGSNNPLLSLANDLEELQFDAYNAIKIPICLITRAANDDPALQQFRSFLYGRVSGRQRR